MQHDNSHPTTFSASDNKYPASYIKIVYKALSTKAKIRSYPQRASGAGHHINCTLSINTVSEYCAERISDPLFIHCYSSTHGVHSLSLRVKSPLHFRNGSDTQNQPQPLLILNPSVPNFFIPPQLLPILTLPPHSVLKTSPSYCSLFLLSFL